MGRPHYVTAAPEPPDNPNEFDRPQDFETQAGGPREFAKLTEGSWSEAGRSQIIAPDPQ